MRVSIASRGDERVVGSAVAVPHNLDFDANWHSYYATWHHQCQPRPGSGRGMSADMAKEAVMLSKPN